MTRFICPVHDQPDCSPLLNGCNIPNQFADEPNRCLDLTEFPGGFYRCILPAGHENEEDPKQRLHRIELPNT